MPAESPLRDAPGTGTGLIETFRWEAQTGFLRLDKHLDRMAGSASALGISFSREAALETVARVGGEQARRVRLALSPGGEFSLTVAPFVPVSAGTIWRLRIARTSLTSSDPLLRHKTTHRDVYERARAEFAPGEVEEVLLCNEAGAVCEGSMTNLFVAGPDGRLKTPALACGLLPGILRQELLAAGKVEEVILAASDLYEAPALFVGNSLRGLIPARIVRE